MEALRESRLCASFTEPRLLAGVDFKLFTINVAVAVFMLATFHLWQWLILTVIAHYFFKNMTKNDPDALEVYTKYSKQGDRYEPWPLVDQQHNQRPVGFARGDIC